MSTVANARAFVQQAALPDAPRTRAAEPLAASDAPLVTGKNQAAVVGSEIVSFVSGVTAERREAIINSALLAQLVAKKRVPDATRVYEWYDAYFDALTNIGWVVQDRNFAEYHEESENFEAHKAILSVATALLGATPAALSLVKTTLEALQSMNASSPWITLFSRESQTARTARFQVTLAEQEPSGQFLVSLMAFGLEAQSTITQVLFFKARKNEVRLRHHSGRVTINTAVVDAIRDDIKQKLADRARQYVKTLPDLD